MKDYYKILGVEETSSIEEIKQAYRSLAKTYHPDINTAVDANERFLEISEAYEHLLQLHNQLPDKEDVFDYDKFIKDIHEAAKEQARLRKEKVEKQREAFQKSGLYDLGLLLKYAGRFFIPLLGVGLISIPVFVCFSEHSIQPFFYLFFIWLIGGMLLYNTFQERKKRFQPGKFYYSFGRIKSLFTETEDTSDDCFYCNGLKGSSLPFKLELLKIKNIQLRNDGPMQHQAGFNRKSITVLFPRSRKAFRVHTIVSGIKVFTILFTVIFFPLSSIVWRLLFGIFFAWLIASVVLMLYRTRSKSGYLLSYGMLIKTSIWMYLIIKLSAFQWTPFDIKTSPFINFGIALYLFLDAFVEQILKIPKTFNLFKPIPKCYKNLDRHFSEKCLLYLELPYWTTLSPFFKWLF